MAAWPAWSKQQAKILKRLFKLLSGLHGWVCVRMSGGYATAKIGPHFSRAIGPSGRPGRRARRLCCGLSPTRLVLGICMSIMVLLMVRMPGDYRDDAEDGAVGDDSEALLQPDFQVRGGPLFAAAHPLFAPRSPRSLPEWLRLENMAIFDCERK